MADENYRNLSIPELLKKSEELMMGHKMDYFLLNLSFIGWILLAIPTLGLIMIWVGPYMSVSQAKFLNDVKEKVAGTAPAAEVKEEKTEVAHKTCPGCGAEIKEGTAFCPECGKEVQ